MRTYEVQDQQDSALLLSATTDEDLTDWPWQLQGFLHPPGFWGQTSAMAGLPAPATVVARSFCELFLLPIDDLTQVCAATHEVPHMRFTRHRQEMCACSA